VLNADPEVVFRKDTEGLWEEMLQQTRRIRAHYRGKGCGETGQFPCSDYAAALALDFSNTILPPR
jgi:hypothetical protein